MNDQAYGSVYVFVAEPVSIPSSADLSADFPPPKSQGTQPSCVGWAVAYALKSYQEHIERRWGFTSDRHLMSPAYVYNQIKLPWGGAQIVDGLNLLVDKGVSSLDTMPYMQNNDTDEPSPAAEIEAPYYRIATWGKVKRDSHSTFVLEIKRHLIARRPVVIGIHVNDDFVLKKGNRIYDDPSGQFLGLSRNRHAVVIVGYDDAMSAFKFINSWGTNYGENGYGWIDYTASKHLIKEAYVTDDVVATEVNRPPGAASAPVPDDAAVRVAAGGADTTLSWTRNERTTSFDVYVGPDSALGADDFQRNTAQPTLRVPLAPGSTYYWRVDARGADGMTRGPVWSFTTAGTAETPLKPTNPRPANGATAVSSGVLNWDSGGRATTYDVYIGTDSSLGSSDLQRTQATRTFYPNALVAGTRYYWRIDAKNSRGTTRGDTWSFTTAGPTRTRTLSIADASATEGRSLTFAVTLSAASASTVTVQYRTANGTAISSDYRSASGTLRFTAGETRKTISVRTTDDTRDENNETFYVNLSNASGATISDGRATGTIIDNDGARARPSLSIADASATEGQSLTFAVTLSAAAASAVTVQYRTANGTAISSDYRSASGTLRFAAGDTRKTISVRTTDDRVNENNETITVSLSNASGATISDGRATGTIIDNDGASPSPADQDHGDSRGTAHELSNCGSGNRDWTINGYMSYRGSDARYYDKDYFKLVCDEARGTLTAWTTGRLKDDGGRNADVNGDILYGNGDRAARDHGFGRNFRVSRSEVVGTYYVRVTPVWAGSTDGNAIGPYNLHVRWRPYDAPDRYQDAYRIGIGGSGRYARYIHRNDADWFKFDPGSGGGCIDFRVWSSMESRISPYFSTDPDAFVSDGQGGAKLRQDTRTGHFDMSGILRKHGYYYFVKVTPKGTNTGPYTLNLRFSTARSCSGVLN